MALGGGTFLTQNKVLPGTYINFISVAKASATISDRGYAALGVTGLWGPENQIFEVTNGDFQKNSLKVFGYGYAAEALKGLRDLFANIKTLYCYRLDGGGVKASCAYAAGKYGGTRGNSLSLVIAENVDDNTKSDVTVKLDGITVDQQTVTTSGKTTALEDDDYVTWIDDVALTAGTYTFSGGTDATVTSTSHQNFLDAAESWNFNAIGYVGTDDAVAGLYANYTKRMRDEVGKKFQCVLYNCEDLVWPDHEGVVVLDNKCATGKYYSSGWVYPNEACTVYWVLGAIAGCAVNRSNTNRAFGGEYAPETTYTQAQLEANIQAGKFTLHSVDGKTRVLTDINSFITVSDEKGDVFKSNQTVRVIDNIANDIASVFNTRYLGVVQNDAAGRASLWNDIDKYHQDLQSIRAIQEWDNTQLKVEQGDTKSAVAVSEAVNVVNAMEKLYMTVYVS